jgi:hypothetical protein
MRKLLSLILALPLLASAAHVQFFANDAALSGVVTNRTIRIQPSTNPIVSGQYIITGDYLQFEFGTNVSVTISNLVYGNYAVNLISKRTITPFTILVPNTNTLLNATGLITSSLSVPAADVGYSQSAADARFMRQATNYPGTAGQYAVNDGSGFPYWATVAPGGGSGEVNTSSNVGDGIGIANAKVAYDLPFKSFKSANKYNPDNSECRSLGHDPNGCRDRQRDYFVRGRARLVREPHLDPQPGQRDQRNEDCGRQRIEHRV